MKCTGTRAGCAVIICDVTNSLAGDAGPRDSAGRLREVPVLIAGGGPAGLAAAAELDHHGVACLVIEPRTTVSHTRPRAKTTSVRTMEHFRRWGIAEAVRAAAPLAVEWSDQVVFCDSLLGREITRFPGAFGLSATRVEAYAESSQVVPQPVIEEVLREFLVKSPGVTFEWGSSVSAVHEHHDRVEVTVTEADGTARTVTAAYVLGCDGPGSVVRKQIGAGFVGRSDPRPNFNVVFRAPGLVPSLPRAVQYWIVGGPVPGLIGRLDLDGTWWAIFPGVEEQYGSRNAARLIETLVGGPVEIDVLASDPWAARMLVADRFQTARIFLVGEAAHLNPPWGGHGFNTSVGDAVNIGWKLAAVLRGWGGPTLPASYQAERRPVVQRTIASAEGNLSALAGDLPSDAASIQSLKRSEFHSLGLVLGYGYDQSPVIQEVPRHAPSDDVSTYQPSAEPGGRLPHLWLEDGASLYNRLGRGLTLIGPDLDDNPEAERLLQHASAAGVPLTLLSTPSGYPYRDRYLLVRPDQHIAWSGTTLRDAGRGLLLALGNPVSPPLEYHP